MHACAPSELSPSPPSPTQVVPEPVDTAFFDPTKHKPLPLPLGLRVFGPAWPHQGGDQGEPFVFLSVFKWEARKVSMDTIHLQFACALQRFWSTAAPLP